MRQKQLLSFACSVVKKTLIMILDEATSNIDLETEKLIEEVTARLMEGRLSIIIVHRLSTFSKVDSILVFRKGSLVQEGNHQELLNPGIFLN